METARAWCQDCSRIVKMEDFQSCIDAVSKVFVQKSNTLRAKPVRHWWDLHLFIFLWKWKARLQAWEQSVYNHSLASADMDELQELISVRKSERCLECGSEAVSRFSGEDEHPHCGGRIYSETLAVAGSEVWVSHRFVIDLYSQDGLYIRTDVVNGHPFPDYLYREFLQMENARIRGISIPASAAKMFNR